jgi:excisionase family DNA binding protein
MYSTKEAAEKMKLSQERVRALAQAGLIPAKKVGNSWVILELTYKRRRKPKRQKGGN